MGSASKYELPFKLNNPNLLHNQSFIGGEWKGSKSGNEFDVVGQSHMRAQSHSAM